MVPGELTLGELLAATRLVETNLLAFHFACITRDKAGLGQCRLQHCIVFDQGTGNAVTDSTSLSGFTTTSHIDLDIEPLELLNQFKRLTNDHASGFAGEKLIDRLAIDDNGARTTFHENTSDGALATTGTVEITFSHDDPLDFQRLGLLGGVRMLFASVALQLLEHGVAQRTLRQHALDGGFQGTARETLLHLLEIGFGNAARIA